MLQWLLKLFASNKNGPTQEPEYDPVYGLPKRAVAEWLARNPQSRQEYEVLEWLARNPPLRREYEEARKQGLITQSGRPRFVLGNDTSATQNWSPRN